LEFLSNENILFVFCNSIRHPLLTPDISRTRSWSQKTSL